VATVGGHWELRAAALRKTVWWGMRLASLLTHLFFSHALYLFSSFVHPFSFFYQNHPTPFPGRRS